MLRSSNPAEFRDLFDSKFVSVNWSNMDSVVELDRKLLARVKRVWENAWDPEKHETNKNRLTAEDRATYDYFNEAMRLITSKIRDVLETPRPPEAHIDLSFAYLWEGDWRGINFDEANLEGTWFESMDLQNRAQRSQTLQWGETSRHCLVGSEVDQ
jgi:Pentapeptide repeats (8 copies)